MSQVLQALSLQGVVWMFNAIYCLLADSGMAFCQTFRMQNEAKLMIDTYANYKKKKKKNLRELYILNAF